MITLEQLEKNCNTLIKKSTTAISVFKQDLDKDPMKALKWSSGVFDTVAMADICETTLTQIKNGLTVDQIKKELLDCALFTVNTSSLETSNMIERARQQACASLLRSYFM